MICPKFSLFPLLSLSSSLLLFSSCFASPTTSPDSSTDLTLDTTTPDDAMICTAQSTYLESHLYLRVKIRPPPGNCSIHEAFYRLQPETPPMTTCVRKLSHVRTALAAQRLDIAITVQRHAGQTGNRQATNVGVIAMLMLHVASSQRQPMRLVR